VAARKALYYSSGRKRDVTFTQGNLLSLPIADESLDLVVTSGALEYVPLGDGLTELARVIAPGGHLLHFPVHPGLAGVVLEILFRFKSHPPQEVISKTEQHFRIVHQYRFPRREAIGWSKTAILAQKV
jgi:ubiquinone/menaquinone biosynthesis C-methylase UbiE